MSYKTYEPKPLFLERMKKLLNNELETYLKAIKNTTLNSIRCNTLKISPEELKKRLENKGWKIKQPFEKYSEIMVVEGKINGKMSAKQDGLNNKENSKVLPTLTSSPVKNMTKSVLNERFREFSVAPDLSEGANYQSASDSECNLQDLSPGELGRALEHMLGYYYIQEISSMMPVLVLQPKPREIILDLAAAPGSKTTQISMEMKNTGTIIANDLMLNRIKILASNLERCGAANVIITRKDGAELCKKLKEQNFQADKILLDAPCSGEGTIISNPKTSLMWNIQTVKNLSRLQKRLVTNAFELLKPNGILVYSTCTHAPEENEEIIDFVLSSFKDVEIEKISIPLKCRKGVEEWNGIKYNKEVEKTCRIYPQDNNSEGFFIAKIRKKK